MSWKHYGKNSALLFLSSLILLPFFLEALFFVSFLLRPSLSSTATPLCVTSSQFFSRVYLCWNPNGNGGRHDGAGSGCMAQPL